MGFIGWVLIVLGCVWTITGLLSVIGAAMAGAYSGIAMGLATLGLAVLALWGGGRLRGKAKALGQIKSSIH